MNVNISSWKTTAAAVAGLLGLLSAAAQALLDADPATNPDWNTLFVLAMPMVGLLFARDNAVSSEAAGAQPPAK